MKYLLLSFILCLPAWGQSVVQACENSVAATATTLAITCSTANGSGLVLVTGQSDDQGATATVANSVAQSFTEISCGQAISGALSFQGRMFYLANSSASTAVTVTWSGSRINRTGVILEMSGMATSSMLDGCAVIGGVGNVAALTSGPLTTANANDILVYSVIGNADPLTYTVGSGYTIPANGTTTTLIRQTLQYKIVSATQSAVTTSLSWTGGPNGAVGLFAAFKAAPPAAGGRKPIIIIQ